MVCLSAAPGKLLSCRPPCMLWHGVTTRVMSQPAGTDSPHQWTGLSVLNLAPAVVFPWFALQLQAVSVQPVSIVMRFEQDNGFQFFGGGLFTADRCWYPEGAPTWDSSEFDHAMLVVGFNTSASPPFWVLKNSWGPE
jgi:hypothetical protein